MSLLVLSLAPVIIILAYVYIRDKYEKEPLRLVLKGLAAGAIILIPAAFIEEGLGRLPESRGLIPGALYTGFVVAGATEELLKFLMVYLLFFRNRNFNERYDGIVYSVAVSLGFAALENVLYVFRGGMQVGLLRAFTAVPAHAFFGMIMGYYFGLARFVQGAKSKNLLKAIALPWFFHGLYDFILYSQNPWLLLTFVPLMIVLLVTGMKRIKQHQLASAFNPKSESFLELPADEADTTQEDQTSEA
ncbi:MAG TPA: PrsW family glutamic-type intramembrane protease [Bacteroidales bacterium]|nr:PrsW family glutamic-type intramembrane protease [Bacteroidales bacterium]